MSPVRIEISMWRIDTWQIKIKHSPEKRGSLCKGYFQCAVQETILAYPMEGQCWEFQAGGGLVRPEF